MGGDAGLVECLTGERTDRRSSHGRCRRPRIQDQRRRLRRHQGRQRVHGRSRAHRRSHPRHGPGHPGRQGRRPPERRLRARRVRRTAP
nr:MAG TPA: hypothetical protein [Caudoviricetes sp.]